MREKQLRLARRRMVDDDRIPGSKRADPSKLTAEDAIDGAAARAGEIDPGKLSGRDRDDAMSPADAVRYSASIIDRRARPGEEQRADDAGALATAFDFLDDVRPGQPLPARLLAELGAALDADLSSVRVHTDGRAARAAAALGADALTIGTDIFFAAGTFDPAGVDGLRLIAHECAHAAQNLRGARRAERAVSRPEDAHERDAEAFAERFAREHGAGADRDPARLVDRVRRDGRRIDLPFLAELEEHFGTSFDFVEAYAGEAAQLACELMSAGAFAVRNIVAFADPSPQRDQLMHELAHVIQMGGRSARAPAQFGVGTLRVGDEDSAAEHDARGAVAGGRVAAAASPDVIHRDTKKDDFPEWSLEVAEKRWKKFLETHDTVDFSDDSGDGWKEDAIFGKPHGTGFQRYRNTSKKPFMLAEYQAELKIKEKDKPKTERDLKELHAAKWETLGLVKASDMRWAWVNPKGTPKPVQEVVDLKRKEREAADPNKQFRAYADGVAALRKINKSRLAKFTRVFVTDDKSVSIPLKPKGNVVYSKEEADACRHQLVEWVDKEADYHWNEDGEWSTLFKEVLEPAHFEQAIAGKIFSTIATKDMAGAGFKVDLKETYFRSSKFESDSKLRRGDGFNLDGNRIVVEFKSGGTTGKPGADPTKDSKIIKQARDYAKIIKSSSTKSPIYAYNVDEKKQQGGWKEVAYIFPTGDMAKAWAGTLKPLFPAGTLFTYPDADTKGVGTVKLKANPTFEIPLDNDQGAKHVITNPAVFHPGAKISKATITTKGKGSTEVTGGEVVFDTNLGGAVSGKAKPAPISPAPDGGTIKNKLDGLESTFGKIFKRVKPSAELTDKGVKATLGLEEGPSGLKNLTIAPGANVSVTYEEGNLSASGGLKLLYKAGGKDAKEFTADVKVGYAGGDWSFTGTVGIPANLVAGLDAFEAFVKYDRGKWSFGTATAVKYTRKQGAITVTGTVHGVEYDVDAGQFSGGVVLEADLGMFGRASGSAELKKNQLTRAELSYDSPELKYPGKSEKPALSGTIGGTLTYDEGKFAGKLRGTAGINIPALKKIAGNEGLGIAVNAQIHEDGSYSGTVGITEKLTFGKYLEIPTLDATLQKDGSIKGSFEVKVVNLKKFVDNASIKCKWSKDGIEVDELNLEKGFGTENKSRFWGKAKIGYSKEKGLDIGGTINAKIKEGMVASADIKYLADTQEISLKFTVPEITLLDKKLPKKVLFQAEKTFPLVMIYALGIYVEIGFELGFESSFKLGLKPSITFDGLDLNTFDFKKIRAEIELIGELVARLSATPKLGVGLFALSPMLLRGGGGLKLPIVGEGKVIPKGKLGVEYDPQGGVSGDAQVGMALTFEIFAALEPYALVSVLDGAWKKDWTGDALAKFQILPKKELFSFQLDLGGDLTKKEPALPGKNEAKAPTELKGKKLEEEKGTEDKKEGKAADREADPVKAPVQEKGEDGPFSIGALKPLLEKLPGYGTIDKILRKASAAWDKIKGFFSDVFNALKDVFSGLADAAEEIIDGFAAEGLDYLPKLIKKVVGSTVYDIIEPLISAVAGNAKELLELLKTDAPKSAADFFPWALKLLLKVAGIAINGIDSLVSAVKEIGKRLKDKAKQVISQMVQEGWIGVKRHVYWVYDGVDAEWAFWNSRLTRWYFMAATQYKIRIPGIFSMSPFKASPPIIHPKNVIAFALWQTLEGMGVEPTYKGWDEDAQSAYWNYWVGADEG